MSEEAEIKMCVLESDAECLCEGSEICKDLVQYKMFVYCDDANCAWFSGTLPFKKHVSYGRGGYAPFPADFAKGMCTRVEIALSPKEISDLVRRHKVTSCVARSDKTIKGHLDFSRFPQGGVTHDEPIPADTAYFATGAKRNVTESGGSGKSTPGSS